MSRREERRNATIDEIKKAAWEQMEKNGPSAISLREISRSMKMSSAAIYRYFASQADLLGALSREAVNCQIDALADSILSDEDVPGRLIKLGIAYRRWAVENPVRYMLVYGSPIPGYKPNWTELTPIFQRGLDTFLTLLQEGLDNGQLKIPDGFQLGPDLTGKLQSLVRARKYDFKPETLYWAIIIWSRIHGLVSLEINGQMELLISDPFQLFLSELQALVRNLQPKE